MNVHLQKGYLNMIIIVNDIKFSYSEERDSLSFADRKPRKLHEGSMYVLFYFIITIFKDFSCSSSFANFIDVRASKTEKCLYGGF